MSGIGVAIMRSNCERNKSDLLQNCASSESLIVGYNHHVRVMMRLPCYDIPILTNPKK